jgi:hypothetical protein
MSLYSPVLLEGAAFHFPAGNWDAGAAWTDALHREPAASQEQLEACIWAEGIPPGINEEKDQENIAFLIGLLQPLESRVMIP